MSSKQRKQNRGWKGEKSFALFTEYKFYLVIAVAITFVFFIGTARSGTFFGLTLNVNTNLENGLVGHWTFDGKDTTLATSSDSAGSNDGTILGLDSVGGQAKASFTTAGSENWSVPSEVTSITVKAWGAGGGGGSGGSLSVGGPGAGGGFTEGTISVTPQETLAVYVGGFGVKGLYSSGGGGTISGDGAGGGGYSAIKRGVSSLILAAGGAGGGGGDNSSATAGGTGGTGGGTSGWLGTASLSANGGVGGTQSAGGSGGTGGSAGTAGTSLQGGTGGASTVSCNPGGTAGGGGAGGVNGGGDGGIADAAANGCAGGGGGGGGYYGGGGGSGSVSGNAGGGGGGGGSSFLSPSATATSTSSGSGTSAGNNTDEDYVAGKGAGGTGGAISTAGVDGGNGLVVIAYETATTSVLTSTPGRLGSAIDLDGINDYVDIGATGQTVKTVAFWIKADSLTEDILDLNGTADVTVSAGTISANSFTSPTIYVDGEVSSTIDTGWRHVVITTATGISASNMDIGRANGAYFDGALDDVRIYNRVLSATEITRLAELGMTTKISNTIYSNPELESGLLGHWTLDGKDTSNATATDRIADNDGSINGNEIIATTTFSVVASGLGGTVTAIDFNTDGTKMFILKTANDDVDEYTLSVPFDLSSTVTYVDSLYINAEEPEAEGMAFNNDGTKMYITGKTNDSIIEYSLASFDTSTASFVSSTSVSAQNTQPSGLTFNNDGTKMFMTGFTGSEINEYTLSTPWDTTTLNFVDSLSVGAYGGNTAGIVFDSTGAKMFTVGFGNDTVNEFTLTTAFDISTATHLQSFDVSAQNLGPSSIAFNNHGTKLFVAGWDASEVNEYSLTEGFDLGGAIDVSLATQGRLGAAMEFDGIDDYVDISGLAATVDETQGTMAVWVYVASDDLDLATHGIFEVGDASSGNDYLGFRQTTSDTIRFRYTSGGTLNGVNVAAQGDTWVHYTATWDATNINLYENGVLTEGPTAHAGVIGSTLLDQAVIGADASAGIGNYFKGKIDDVRIYNRVLSADQIKRLAELGMTTRIGVTPPENPNTAGDLVGHWSFDGKETTIISAGDKTGSNNGTISGHATYGTPGLGTDTYTTAGSGSWTAPDGVTQVTMHCWGAGGAGGGGIQDGEDGAGGGGGAFASSTISVTSGSSYSYTVGAGGVGSLGAAGSAGGNTSFNTNSCIAAGGGGGALGVSGDGVGGATAASTGSVKYAGGNGDYRGVQKGGGGGGSAGTGSAGNNAVTETAAIAVTGGGPGGVMGDAADGSVPVSGPGGGGGGAGGGDDGDTTGGAGYAGKIELSYIAGASKVPMSTPGKLSSALKFDGTNDYVDIGTTGQTVKSVAFWIKADSLTEDILDLNGTADVTVSAGTLSANSFTSPTIYVDGVVGSTITTGWHHVVITTATGISASNMDIGRANSAYFDGKLDDVRIYSKALSADEVQRLYQTGT